MVLALHCTALTVCQQSARVGGVRAVGPLGGRGWGETGFNAEQLRIPPSGVPDNAYTHIAIAL